MVGVPQGAMRVALQIWQVVVLASQTLQVFYFGPSQKGTICSSDIGFLVIMSDNEFFQGMLIISKGVGRKVMKDRIERG
jgi:hypothetical protein